MTLPFLAAGTGGVTLTPTLTALPGSGTLQALVNGR